VVFYEKLFHLPAPRCVRGGPLRVLIWCRHEQFGKYGQNG
jgi:hypothetical protein